MKRELANLIETQMVKIVGLRRREEGEVVARVWVEGVGDDNGVPDPHRRHVRPAHDRAKARGQKVWYEVFYRGDENVFLKFPIMFDIINFSNNFQDFQLIWKLF